MGHSYGFLLCTTGKPARDLRGRLMLATQPYSRIQTQTEGGLPGLRERSLRDNSHKGPGKNLASVRGGSMSEIFLLGALRGTASRSNHKGKNPSCARATSGKEPVRRPLCGVSACGGRAVGVSAVEGVSSDHATGGDRNCGIQDQESFCGEPLTPEPDVRRVEGPCFAPGSGGASRAEPSRLACAR